MLKLWYLFLICTPVCLSDSTESESKPCEENGGTCIHKRDICSDSIEGFYVDPRVYDSILCSPCLCPGVPGSDNSHANRCFVNPETQEIICECHEGYAGSQCDICADNYYGNPTEPGGVCQPCDCDSQIDLSVTGSCDPHTGKCKQCLDNTTGNNCESCKLGFFRPDKNEPCQQCVCHALGTDHYAGGCDQSSGQCPCLPNVTGLECDTCEVNYWNITNRKGCKPCNCDPFGSISEQCNQLDGACDCKPGFGGKQCNECVANFWGNPLFHCYPCRCNFEGSETTQCNRQTGACTCKSGVGGEACDECDRGYYGSAPSCLPCGKCFDNWDGIIQDLKNETKNTIDKTAGIQTNGGASDYSRDFYKMLQDLDEADNLLKKLADIDLRSIYDASNNLQKQIATTEFMNQELDDLLVDARQNILLNDNRLKAIDQRIQSLERQTRELEKKNTQLQESNVQGALNSIENIKERTKQAAYETQNATNTIEHAGHVCKPTKNFPPANDAEFHSQLDLKGQELKDLDDNVKLLFSELPGINNLVCDGKGNFCHPECGGGGCGNCGESTACKDGAVQLTEGGYNIANTTRQELTEIESEVNDFVANASQTSFNLNKRACQKTYDKAEAAFLKSNRTVDDVKVLARHIQEFLNQNSSQPEDVKALALEILDKNIQLQPEKIKRLAEFMRKKIDSLQHIKHSINEANDVSKEGEKDIHQVIKDMKEDIDMVNKLIKELSDKIKFIQLKINNTNYGIDSLKKELAQLQNNITDSYANAKRLVATLGNINQDADTLNQKSTQLQTDYQNVVNKLDNKLAEIRPSEERAKQLNLRAEALKSKIAKLGGNPQEDKLDDLEIVIEELTTKVNSYAKIIEEKAIYYNTC